MKNQLTVVKTLTIAELKSRYRNTVAGLLWVMLNPIIQFSVHALIFKHILKINVDNYYIFLLSGLLPWIFMSNMISQSVSVFITRRESLLAYQIHPISLIISKAFDSFINFIIPFTFLFVLLWFNNDFNLLGILHIPILMLVMLIGTIGLAAILSTLQVFFRDIEYIIQFVISIMFFLTPIFYPRELVPDRFQIFVDINPFYAFIRGFKAALWNFDQKEIWTSVAHASFFAGIICLISYITWKKFRNEVFLKI